MKVSRVLFLFVMCSLLSCAEQEEQQYNETFTIKWDNDNRDKIISSIIDTAYYIPIETHPDGLFGRVDKVVMTKDKIFLLDELSQNVLLVFDRSGKFLFKAGKRGGGPEEHNGVMNFAVDDKHIYLLDRGSYNVLIYDMENKFVDRIKNRVPIDDLVPTKEGFLVSYAYYQTKVKLEGDIKEYRLFSTDKKFNKKKDYLPISNDFCLLKKSNNFSVNGDKILYHAFGMDYVAVFDSNNIENSETYTFDFGDRSIPADKRYNTSSVNDEKYDCLKSVFFGGKYILGDVGGREVFVLDTDTRDVYRNIEIKFNEKGEPIMPSVEQMEGIITYPLGVCSDEIISYVTGAIYKQMIAFGYTKADDVTHSHLLADDDNIAMFIKKFK